MAVYTIECDDKCAILVCRITGFLTETEAAKFDNDWRNALIKAHRRFNRIRIIFDNRLGQVLPTATIERMGRSTRDLYKPGDRTAILVSGSLARIQAKRTSSHGGMLFESEEEARNWLGS